MEESAKNLHKAMRGLGTNEGKIIREICDHSSVQRQEIKKAYFNLYKKSLEDDLKSEISGRFLKGVLMLLKPTDEFEAECLYHAMKGLGTKESVLIEILCSKMGKELQGVAFAFQRLYGNSLASWVKDDVGGDFGKLLENLANCQRDDSYRVDQKLAHNEATDLYKAGEKRLGTDEKKFINIFAMRNFSQLDETFKAYAEIAGSDIEVSIRKEMSGDLATALVTIAKCVRNRPLYFAERMNEAMKGFGTKDDMLMRLLVSRAEVDLKYVKIEYEKQYGKSLYDAVKSELSGDYESLFLRLIGKN